MNRPGSSVHSHRDAWDLIPWLATGRLSPAESESVNEHLRGCESCRRELADQQRLRAVMRQQDNLDYAPGPSLQKLLWRLDEIATAPPPAAVAPPVEAGRRRRRPGGWPRWLLAAQAAVIAILAVAVLFQSMESSPVYRTVTVPRAAGADLRILFAPGTTARQIQLMLGASGTVIVDGPSSSGIYSLALAPGVPPSAVSGAAETLRAHPEVLFVEAQPP